MLISITCFGVLYASASSIWERSGYKRISHPQQCRIMGETIMDNLNILSRDSPYSLSISKSIGDIFSCLRVFDVLSISSGRRDR
jgi:hypothetical protein